MGSRNRWKFFAVLTAVMVLGAVALCLFLGKLQSRKEFVSKPLQGYRCRFTRIADWKLLQDDSDASNGSPEDYTFFAPPLSPMQQWIADHLYREPTSTGNFPELRQTLSVSVTTAKDITEDIQIQNGYPEPNLHGFGQILSERHLCIDGCPASVSRVNIMFATPPVRGTILLVDTPDHSRAYSVWSMADRRYADQADSEMRAIISSFHIEKTPISSGGNHSLRQIAESASMPANTLRSLLGAVVLRSTLFTDRRAADRTCVVEGRGVAWALPRRSDGAGRRAGHDQLPVLAFFVAS